MTTSPGKTRTHYKLLQELTEIKAVLDVESELIRTLVKMAIARQNADSKLSF